MQATYEKAAPFAVAWDLLEQCHRQTIFTGAFEDAEGIEQAMRSFGPLAARRIEGTVTETPITTGKAGGPGGGGGRSRSRRRAGATTGRRSGGANGSGLSGEQLLSYLQQHPGPQNQSELAKQFGVSRQTVAKRLAVLSSEGAVSRQGSGRSQAWAAKELQPA